MIIQLTNMQLKKLNSAVKNMAATILRLNLKKKIEDEKLTHNLLLITRQTTKIRNTFCNNISIDIKLS